MTAASLPQLAAAIEADAEPPMARRGKIDTFAAILRVDAAALRHDVRSAAAAAELAVAIRRDHRKAAADGKRILTGLIPRAEQAARQISRLDPTRFVQTTVAKAEGADGLAEAMVRQARDLAATLRQLQTKRDYPRLAAGGGTDQDQLAAKLIERLARIWTRHTNQPAPGGASGPFVEFAAAAWMDLGLPEFKGRDGSPMALLDAIGGRVVKFHLRHNRDEKSSALCTKRSARRRACSQLSKRE
ncbi:hypothetical protein [Bradyrhizobium stylosanthis]|uniref:hypothetical protein n=1 Tax=Bradyrhizobium stylosanthis TaxID=1803665 RepID=UPI0007C554BD|nr:hypothetical protein [Bradyrhizobium stylosanthis]